MGATTDELRRELGYVKIRMQVRWDDEIRHSFVSEVCAIEPGWVIGWLWRSEEEAEAWIEEQGGRIEWVR